MPRELRIPNLQLPKREKPFFGGTATSVAVHGLFLFAIYWTGTHIGEDFLAAGGSGPLGGGGGGGGRVIHIELPAYVSSSGAAQPEEQAEPETVLPIPRPNLRRIPTDTRSITRVRPTGPVAAAEVLGRGSGTGGDEGAGTGTGGGQGSGEGTGVGSGVGPGTGGDGGDGIAAQSRQMLLPPPDAPPSVKGQEYRVRFFINERGRVVRVEIEPRIPDSDYRKEFRDRMLQFRFYPARNLEGDPTASYYDAWIIP